VHIIIISPQPIEIIDQVMATSYPELNITNCSSSTQAKELLFDSGPYSLVVISEQSTDENSELFSIITEDIGAPMTLLLGTAQKETLDTIAKHDCLNHLQDISISTYKGFIDKILIKQKNESEEQRYLTDKTLEDFVPLKLKTFYLYKTLPYDAYTLITTNRFMKVLPKDIEYHEGLIQKLKFKHIRCLYLEKNNHVDFLDQAIKTMTQEVKKGGHSPKRIIKILISGATLVQDYLRTIGPSDNILPFINELTLLQTSFLKSGDQLKIHQQYFKDMSHDIGEQAICKSILCEMIASKLNWTFDKTREKLFFTSLLHDNFIANEQDACITDLETVKDSKSRKQLEQHPMLASKFAQQFTHLTEIDFIIKQHHLIPDYRCFPEKIPQGKINQISALFIIVNHYVSELINLKINYKNHRKLLAQMDIIYTHTAFKTVYTVFKKLIK
jgi:hypothetical protein